ncbi:chlorsulfuron/imidazolinone resistant 1 [Perilla frutescens var. hirtella]|uniref:Chlorsulfuron/imidazolinone resistant 1 n=1 Tax=Perilla frutescens var. hirtella TaxID=608512 RepID=A0AAD4JAV5_PERFH|nr:chlorsulfuron/imidazolinone resistant 1 [Perilla frutescens var. hirtella]
MFPLQFFVRAFNSSTSLPPPLAVENGRHRFHFLLPSPSPSISRNSPILTKAKLGISRFTVPFPHKPQSSSAPISRRRHLQIPNVTSSPATSTSRFGPHDRRKGSDVLVEALEREGVTVIFAYPAPRRRRSTSLSRAPTQSATFSPATSRAAPSPPRAMPEPPETPESALPPPAPASPIWSPASPTPSWTACHVDDIPRIVKEAFFIARSGRPGPVLIDIPKDILQQTTIPKWEQPMLLGGYLSRLPKPPSEVLLKKMIILISESKKPVLYVGGGCLNSSEELRKFVELTGIPVASTLMGLGCFPGSDENLGLQMLGMHGTVYANYAVNESLLEAFASRAKIIHIDIDSTEIGKNKQPHLSICADIKLALQGLNSILLSKHDPNNKNTTDFSPWRDELKKQKAKHPLSYNTSGDGSAISPQQAIQLLDELTGGNVIITTGVGQHQMWAAQFYKFNRPRQWLTSGGLGAMGFGLPAAIGAAVAKPDAVVVDIDGDGSFMMNVQELATVRVENLPIKMMVLNNQHLGMVVQWEDFCCDSNRGDSYLGNSSSSSEIFPDLMKFAEGCDIPAARVTEREELKGAIKQMLDTPGAYLLDVIIPHQEHVLPMIPIGGTFEHVITHQDRGG